MHIAIYIYIYIISYMSYIIYHISHKRFFQTFMSYSKSFQYLPSSWTFRKKSHKNICLNKAGNDFCSFYLLFYCFTVNLKLFTVFKYVYFIFYFDIVSKFKLHVDPKKIYIMMFLKVSNSFIKIYFLNVLKMETAIDKHFWQEKNLLCGHALKCLN